MEIIVVILFFSLSVGVVIRMFATAYLKEKESARLNDAMISAKNTAEIFRVRGVSIFEENGWEENGDRAAGYRKCYFNYGGEDSEFVLEVLLDTEVNGLETGRIIAYRSGTDYNDPILEFDIARYME